MGEKQNRISRAKGHLERAQKSIKVGEQLKELALYEDSVSRSYYGIYHSIIAMTVSTGEEAKTTQRLISSILS